MRPAVRRRPLLTIVSCTVAVVVTTGCALNAQKPVDPIRSEFYASGSVYLYQPLNPTTIWVRDPVKLEEGETNADITSSEFKNALLRDLDTETLRISLSKIGGNASTTIAVVGASVKGESYILTLDYIKYFTHNKKVTTKYDLVQPNRTTDQRTFAGNVPIYKGVGVRIRAEFTALETGLNISGLPALSIAANANRISGRLTVQTLGLTGPQITGLMPIISDISVASIQNAVQAVAAIKAKLYEDSTVAYPKIVGFEAPASQLDAIPAITEFLYGLDEEVVARVSPNPMKKGQQILWLSWEPPSLSAPAITVAQTGKPTK
jgi:hypothetical protein